MLVFVVDIIWNPHGNTGVNIATSSFGNNKDLKSMHAAYSFEPLLCQSTRADSHGKVFANPDKFMMIATAF